MPRPPEIPVVLVVPAVDRRVSGAQVHHREQEGAVADIGCILINEISGDSIPQHVAGTRPEPRDVRLLRCASRTVERAEHLDLVKILSVRIAIQCIRAIGTELRRTLNQERLHVRHPWGWIENGRTIYDEWLPVPRCGVRHPW